MGAGKANSFVLYIQITVETINHSYCKISSYESFHNCSKTLVQAQ